MYHTDPPPRGTLLTPAGQRHNVPREYLDEEEITWPFVFPVVEPGRPMAVMEFYRRHQIGENEFVYLKEGVPLESLSEGVINELLHRKQSSQA